MRIPAAHLSRTTGFKPLENETSKRFLEILARGAIRYCIKNRIPIPTRYEDFMKNIVQVASMQDKNGSFLLEDQREIADIYKLFNVDYADGGPSYVADLIRLATVKSVRTSSLEKKAALREFGGKFYELAEAFGSGICHNRLVFDKIQELIQTGEAAQVFIEEGILIALTSEQWGISIPQDILKLEIV